ncbi:hypothetical protein B0H66DRAFT_589231 [Apodospora peruviana]|uniref:Uncharacterized protein n=1 Tax=Apodospora peruviana TaxID=516989 RepID=A0AAE0IKX6_9PEZI|nr:hypothetical protein B0H66DRAFT_589231 [Apodospora peruviana]
MNTIHDIIHATDRVSQQIADAEAGGDNGPTLSPDELADSIIAKNRVLGILNRTIRDVQSALKSSSVSGTEAGPDLVAMDVAMNVKKSPAEELTEGLKGKNSGLAEQVPSLSKMAEAAGPIVDTFKAIKVKPYLKNYSAMLNSVPIVGLKGDNIMYTETRSGGVRGVEDVWSVFSPIPQGLNVDSTKAVHFFPYKGDFCMSVGTAIWRKRHRDEKDPEIKLAVDNWPKLYLDAWEKIGDSCLPTAKARNVIPFARLAGKDIRFHLVVLTQDNRLLALDGDLKGSGNTFSELKNASDAKNADALALKIQQAAYFSGNIVAIADSNHSWNLDVDFDANTFAAKDQRRIEPLVELTATDIGPVGVKENSGGWIYRRRLQTVADPDGQGEKGDDKLGWDKWIKQDGVTHLGVASPGVMLDLMALTYSLNERYLSTQSVIYPVVNKLQGYATYQEMFLKSQLAASQQYMASGDDAAKQKLALNEAKKLVRSTKIWATTMQKATTYTKGSVNDMSVQLSSVKTQLDQQLIILSDKLVSLETQIKALKDAKSKMDAAFWGSIAAMIVGIGLAIVGVCTGVGVVALGLVGGALFVGGLVAAIHFGNKSQELASQISGLEAEVRDVTKAMDDISFVAQKFGEIEGMYSKLNQFWGRMANASGNLKDMNDFTAAALGAGFLEDQTGILAAIDIVREIRRGCATYLAVMNRSGIVIPDPDGEDDEAGDMIVSDDMDPIKVDPTFRTVGIWNEQVRRATEAVEQGRFAEAEKHMEAADLVDVYIMDMGMAPEVVISAVGTTHQQETAEAADIFDSLASLARYTPLGVALSIMTRDVEVSEEAEVVSGEVAEANDIRGLLNAFAAVSPIGMVVNAIGTAVDLTACETETQQPNQQNGAEAEAEAADLFGDLVNFARLTPFGMVAGLVEEGLSRGVDVVDNNNNNNNNNNNIPPEPREAADIFGDIASIAAGLTPLATEMGLAQQVFASDMDVVPATATRESADLFSVIADFSRFTPVGALAKPIQDATMAAVKVVMRSAPDLFAIAAPFPPDHPSSGMLNAILGQARAHVCTMLDKTVDLTLEAQAWLSQIPDMSSLDAGAATKYALYRGKALLACKLAMEHSRLANNAFVDFNRRAEEDGIRIQREISEKQDSIAALEAVCQSEINNVLPARLQVLDIFTMGLSRINAERKAQDIQKSMERKIAPIQNEIAQLEFRLYCGQTYREKARTWEQLCQETSGKLGSIYNTLSSVKDGIKVDAQAYKDLAATQWDQIRRDVAEVKSTLQPQGSQDMAVVAMDLDLSNGAADMLRASGTDAAPLLQVTRPAPSLLEQLRAQASNAEIVWNNIGTLEQLTYTEDIVGYFDVATNRKVTLKDVIGNIKAAYIQTAVLHYETVEHISSLALMQKTRATSLANQKISPHVFLRGTALSIGMARKQADRVKAFMGEVSPGLTQKLALVKASIEELDKAIATANLDLARRDKAYRDKVTGVIVEGCLRGFATGGLVAAAGFAAYSGVAMASIPTVIAAAGVIFGGKDKKEIGASETEDKSKINGANGVNGKHAAKPEDEEKEAEDAEEVTVVEEKEETDAKAPADKDSQTKKDIPVKQRVQAAQETWTTLSGVMQTAKTAAAGTTLGKALFNKLSLAELVTLVQLVKTAVVVMERTAAAVERLSSPLEELMASVDRVADILDDMDTRCTAQYRVLAAGEDVPFEAKDAAEVSAKWDEVAMACTLWLDIFNAQRISPITYSVI